MNLSKGIGSFTLKVNTRARVHPYGRRHRIFRRNVLETTCPMHIEAVKITNGQLQILSPTPFNKSREK